MGDIKNKNFLKFFGKEINFPCPKPFIIYNFLGVINILKFLVYKVFVKKLCVKNLI